jgi:ATP-dependent Clp protease ATP-binding subunit ClpC
MTDPIRTQIFSVTYKAKRLDAKGTLVYIPAADSKGAHEIVRKPVRTWQTIREKIEEVRNQVKDLTHCAVHGRRREGNTLDIAVRELASEILPESGFSSIVRDGMHPQFDVVIADDPACLIPWEVLEEAYAICPEGGERIMAANDWPFCPQHQKKLTYTSHKLAIDYHMTHLVRGKHEYSHGGKEFWIVEDPNGDLTDPKSDPAGACLDHLDKLCEFLKRQGYEVRRPPGSSWTRSRFVEMIKSDRCAGFYFFGHGWYPEDGDEGCLILAKEQPIWASDVRNIGPVAKFAFINACEGAARRDVSSTSWDIDTRCNSVAEAFASGGGKVVIAPLWPIANVQAADAALEFFSKASQTSALARVLSEVRVASLQRYENGEPHTAWMAYRYFGEPNEGMPHPIEHAVKVAPGLDGGTESRVFDAGGYLNTELFAFDITGILQCAARKRGQRPTDRVAVLDFLSGMLEKGDMTRFILRKLGTDDLDLLLGELSGGREAVGDRAEDAEPGERSSDRRSVTNRSEFSDDLSLLLERVDREVQTKHGEHESRISELAVLRFLTESRAWEAAGLPSGQLIEQQQSDWGIGTFIDENGHLMLDDLDERAKRVIEFAHIAGQQKGTYPITNRLTLAALVAEKSSHAARVFQSVNVDPELVSFAMILATEDQPALTFGLCVEACERVIWPMLEKAREIVEPDQKITEGLLFTSFCLTAREDFKDLIRAWFEVDLDKLAHREPVPLDESPAKTPSTNEPGVPFQIQASDFEKQAWEAVLEAERLCRSQGGTVIRSPYLFVALLDRMGREAELILSNTGLALHQLKHLMISLVPEEKTTGDSARVRLSPNTCGILVRAVKLAESRGRSRATIDDIHTAFLFDGGGIVGELLRQLKSTRLAVVSVPSQGQRAEPGMVSTSLLSKLGNDLTKRVREGKIADIVERDKEIEIVLQTLLLVESPNPVLIGDAGVGKTAIVHGLAQRIVKGECPEKLRGMRIIELPVQSLVANTSFRGQFEQKMQMVLEEASKDTILFIDEIHTLLGAGATMDSLLDAGNMLKSALAQGTIRVIGTTTPSEFRRTISRDKALSRRFHALTVEPPSREATIQILSAQQPVLERNHNVKISAEAKTASVDLSGQYLANERWPAKARDVLDRACAIAVSSMSGGVDVQPEHVARAISMRTGIPFEKVSLSGSSLVENLEEKIKQRIIGQEEVVRTIADAIRTSHHRLNHKNRPRGVFLFVGPCGVGKTELAKVLAEEAFGGPQGLIRFDMGDFTEPHSVSKLLGAPPSYVGYGAGSPLVERLRKRPHSLLLLDEIEHAHEDVLSVLLRLLSEGTLEDNEGNVGDARNAVVVMTTNIIDAEQDGGIGFATRKERNSEALQQHLRSRLESVFPRKLLDRIDRIIAFRAFSEKDLSDIAARQVKEIVAGVREMTGRRVNVQSEVYTWLARQIGCENAGARGLQRTINVYIENPLSELLNQKQPEASTDIDILISDNTTRVQTADVET